MGYKFQFITLAGFHALNYSMFELSRGYSSEQMKAYVELQEKEFAAENVGILHKAPTKLEQGILIVFFKQFKELMLQLLRSQVQLKKNSLLKSF